MKIRGKAYKSIQLRFYKTRCIHRHLKDFHHHNPLLDPLANFHTLFSKATQGRDNCSLFILGNLNCIHLGFQYYYHRIVHHLQPFHFRRQEENNTGYMLIFIQGPSNNQNIYLQGNQSIHLHLWHFHHRIPLGFPVCHFHKLEFQVQVQELCFLQYLLLYFPLCFLLQFPYFLLYSYQLLR